jgi:hypothetical protein
MFHYLGTARIVDICNLQFYCWDVPVLVQVDLVAAVLVEAGDIGCWNVGRDWHLENKILKCYSIKYLVFGGYDCKNVFLHVLQSFSVLYNYQSCKSIRNSKSITIYFSKHSALKWKLSVHSS